MNAPIADVLSGHAQFSLICVDNSLVLPMLPDRSAAHVITDPPYEAAAHTLQRRVKDGERTSSWGGADRRSVQSSPLVCAHLRNRAGVGGRRIRSADTALDRGVLPSGGRDALG